MVVCGCVCGCVCVCFALRSIAPCRRGTHGDSCPQANTRRARADRTACCLADEYHELRVLRWSLDAWVAGTFSQADPERARRARAITHMREWSLRRAVAWWRLQTFEALARATLWDVAVKHDAMRASRSALLRWHRATVVATRVAQGMALGRSRRLREAWDGWWAGIRRQRRQAVQWQDACMYHELCITVRTFFHWRDCTLRPASFERSDAFWRETRLRRALRRWHASLELWRIDHGLVSMAVQQHHLTILSRVFGAWAGLADRRLKEREAVAMYARSLMRTVLHAWCVHAARLRHDRVVDLAARQFRWLAVAGGAFRDWRAYTQARRNEALAEAFAARSLGQRHLRRWLMAVHMEQAERECLAQAGAFHRTKLLRVCWQRWWARVCHRLWLEDAVARARCVGAVCVCVCVCVCRVCFISRSLSSSASPTRTATDRRPNCVRETRSFF